MGDSMAFPCNNMYWCRSDQPWPASWKIFTFISISVSLKWTAKLRSDKLSITTFNSPALKKLTFGISPVFFA